MAVKKMEKSTITIPDSKDNLAMRVKIFIWESNYKENNRKQQIFKKNNRKIYSMLLQNCTPELKGKLKVMDIYNEIKTIQDRIEINNLI